MKRACVRHSCIKRGRDGSIREYGAAEALNDLFHERGDHMFVEVGLLGLRVEDAVESVAFRRSGGVSCILEHNFAPLWHRMHDGQVLAVLALLAPKWTPLRTR